MRPHSSGPAHAFAAPRFPTLLGATALLMALPLAACGDELARPKLDRPRAAVSGGSPSVGSVAEDDRTDATDNTITGIIGRLYSVDRVLDVLMVRMDGIGASFSPPPDDDQAAFRDVLAQVRSRAQYLYDVAAFLMACGATGRPAPIGFTDATVAEADRTDSDGTSSEATLGRLTSVANVLGALAKRMDDIAAASTGVCLVEAPATGPWSPSAGLEALASIQSGAMYVARGSDDLLARF
jgi:hypothetical protein